MLIRQLANEIKSTIGIIEYTEDELKVLHRFCDILMDKVNKEIEVNSNSNNEWDDVKNVDVNIANEMDLHFVPFENLEIAGDNSSLQLNHNEWFGAGTHFTIYTDGACSGNPGPGGYGLVIIDDDKNMFEFSEGFHDTTNNRMELLAPIMGLSMLPPNSNVTMYSDSKYFCDSIRAGWLEGWLKSNWKNGTVKNIDLWKKFIPLYNEHHIEIEWVKGHNGNEYNEICDKLAVEAYKSL